MARHRHHHHRRSRRNPLGVSSGEIKFVAWGAAGAVLTEILPAKLLPSYSSGWMGIGVRAATAFALRMGGKFISAEAAAGLFAGGLIDTAVQIVKNTIGPSIGLSAYWQSYTPLPTNSNSAGVSPMPLPPATLAPAGTMGRGAFGARRGRM